MPNLDDVFLDPEVYYVERGDPFLTEICKADDIIDDHLYNWEWFGITEAEALKTALWAERLQLSYELETLERWWRL
jgi:hypothetical protein